MSDSNLGPVLVAESFTRLDSKLDRLDERLNSVDQTLIKQQVILDEHVRRTNLLEARCEACKVDLRNSIPRDIEEQLRLARRKNWALTGKVFLTIAGSSAGGILIKEALQYLLKVWQ